LSGIWLGIDTTSSPGGVALLKSGFLLAESILPVTCFQSEKLLPAIETTLKDSGVSGRDLSGIGVSTGPGSYTGLRIGISTALGLSAGWQVPLKGVSTLRVIAGSLPEGPVMCCIKARAGEVFAGAFSSPDPLSEEIIPQALYSSAAFEKLLNSRVFSCAGSGRTEISSPGLNWVIPLLDHPRPCIVAAFASILAARDDFDKELEPLYLREFNQKINW
jgi:tRNA threonylcarbamoyladenosine biosynthesis protein TsaB